MHAMHSDAMKSNYIVFQSFYGLENHICTVNLQIILNHNIKKFLTLHSTEKMKFFFFHLFFFFKSCFVQHKSPLSSAEFDIHYRSL
jgi:hypothetical protein